MAQTAEDPLYSVERLDAEPGGWCVMGPNGPAGVYPSEQEAQARADFLNAQVAEESEDDS